MTGPAPQIYRPHNLYSLQHTDLEFLLPQPSDLNCSASYSQLFSSSTNSIHPKQHPSDLGLFLTQGPLAFSPVATPPSSGPLYWLQVFSESGPFSLPSLFPFATLTLTHSSGSSSKVSFKANSSEPLGWVSFSVDILIISFTFHSWQFILIWVLSHWSRFPPLYGNSMETRTASLLLTCV